jgi:hypothetical protein
MLLIGLESSRSPHQCFFRPLLPMLLRTTHFLPREPTERQFLFKSSRALARGLLLSKNGIAIHITIKKSSVPPWPPCEASSILDRELSQRAG